MEHGILLRDALEAVRHLMDAEPPWGDILRSSARLVSGDGAVFLTFVDERLTMVQKVATDPAAERDYAQHFHQQDVLMSSPQRKEGAWLDTQTTLGPRERSRNAYYVDFMCRHRMRQLFSFVIEDCGQSIISIGFQREKASEGLERRLASPAVSAYSRALQLNVARRKASAMHWVASVEVAFSLLDEAILLVNQRSQVLHASALASEFLAGGTGLVLREGALWHPDARVRAKFDVGLIQAAKGINVRVCLGCGAEDKWTVDMVHAPAVAEFGSKQCCLLRISRQRAKLATSERLREEFDLTPAEARVLRALMEGQTAREHARTQGVSFHTVRTQISNLALKLECTRQVDMVRKGLALGAP